MPFINTYNSCDIVSEIYNNKFYKTYSYKIYACGNNQYGQLGIGSYDEDIYIPQKVLINEKIKDIKLYIELTYFITLDNEVYACGCNSYGISGIGSYDKFVYIPQKVLIEEKIKDIKIENARAYFKTIDDEYYACGDNYNEYLGVGSHDTDVYIPQKVLIEEKIKEIKILGEQTYFIAINDEVYACGSNNYRQLGIGSSNSAVCIPQKVLIEEKIKEIKILGKQTYFIAINDEVYACGSNNYGDLGIGSHNKVAYIPQKVLIEEKIKNIKLDCNRIYFITINNEVYGCGDNECGQLGTGSNDEFVFIPQKVLIEEKIKEIKILREQTYFIAINDEVYACGNNNYGHLGIGSRNKVACIPQKVLIEEKIKNIISECNQTFLLTINNEFYAYGDNGYRQLGVGSDNPVVCIPQKVLIEEKIKDIKIHYNRIYFTTIDDEVYVCGNNYKGVLGVGLDDESVCIPQKVKKGFFLTLKLVMPFINTYNSCDIISEIYNNTFYKIYSNKVYAYGDNRNMQLGIGSDKEVVRIPQKVLFKEKIKDIKSIWHRTYFITITNKLYACGINYNGQLGIGSHGKGVHIPQKVLLEEKIKDIKSNCKQTCFITVNDEVYACGDNENGLAGIGSHNKVVCIPQKVLLEEKIKDIKLNCKQTCFITVNDEVYACGDNDDGHLGIGSHDKDVYIPQKVLIEEKIKNIKGDYYHTYFTTIDNTVYACGDNNAGQLGIGSHDKYIYNPQKVLIEEKIKDINFKCERTYFTTINDEVYVCGNNNYGQLGVDSHNKVVYIPQKVLIEEKIKDILIYKDLIYFITSNNELYAYGIDHYGQLGIGSYDKVVCIPQKVLLKEKIKDIKLDWYRTYFITFNNEIYTCGNNAVGQLGNGSHDKVVCIPQKVLIEEKIKNIEIYYEKTYFTAINDVVYVCGSNINGHLDIGSYDKVVCIPQKIEKGFFLLQNL